MPPDGKLGQTCLAEHYIDTGDHKPFKLPCNRIPLFKRPIIQKEIIIIIKTNLRRGRYRAKCKSLELTNLLNLKETNRGMEILRGSECFKFNHDTYPLPRIDQTLEILKNS